MGKISAKMANKRSQEIQPDLKRFSSNDYKEMCKLCLRLTVLKPISASKFATEFDNFSFLEAQIGYQLPPSVCMYCIMKFNEIGSFLKQCQDSHAQLSGAYDDKSNVMKSVSGDRVSDNEDDEWKTENPAVEYCDTSHVNEASDYSFTLEPVDKTDDEDDDHDATVAKQEEPETISVKFRRKRSYSDIDNEILESIAQIVTSEQDEVQFPKVLKKMARGKKERCILAKVCEKCGLSVTNLEQHYKKHWDCRPRKLKCPHCEKCFAKKYSLEVHKKVHEFNVNEGLVCHICSKMFKYDQNLKRHLLVHANGKAFICEHCGKAFTTKQILDEHINIHKNLKPFVCRYCDLAFRADSMRRGHEKAHHLQVRIDAGTSKVRKLKNVKLQNCHLDEKDLYICSHCPKRFDDMAELQKHTRSHCVDVQKTYTYFV